jgi:hypothetical protein
MKTIFKVIVLAILLASCSKEEIQVVGKKTPYNFSVESNDKANPFSAQISWGVDGQDYNDNVKTFGYYSAFDLQEGQEFTLTATTSNTLTIRVYLEDNEIERHLLTSGSPYTFRK